MAAATRCIDFLQRFGTTVEELLLVNADLEPDVLYAGSELCVVPNTCKAVLNA